MKVKVTLTLEDHKWLDFRAECIRRQVSASEKIDEFIESTLKEWKTKKETTK